MGNRPIGSLAPLVEFSNTDRTSGFALGHPESQ